jgi:3-hexulose-6-phosphate synthase
MKLEKRVVQVALDFTTTDEALEVAELAVKAGVDWLEAGTILINAQGYSSIGALSEAFPEYPILADFKTMDAGGRNAQVTHEQGGKLFTVCANAPDETIQAATKASSETDVWVVVDTIGVEDRVKRVKECVEWGAKVIYLHYGFDQHQKDPSQSAEQWLEEVGAEVDVPLAVACFDIEGAVKASKMGADILVVGHPVISSGDTLGELRRFVEEVKGA